MDALRPGFAAIIALILSACAQTTAPSADGSSIVAADAGPLAQESPPAPSDDPMCERSVRLIVNPLVARPGATLKIFSDHPLGYAPPLDVPDELLTRWRASPAGAATFSEDGTQARISETATPGGALTLTALYCGKEDVSIRVPIVGKDEPVIVGFWRQDSVSCTAETPTHQPVKELAIEADGTFSVTYQPFESYRDYWGTQRFDYRSGSLEMSVTGGNQPPAAPDLSGKASLENEKRLVLEGFYLGEGGRPAGASCDYVLVK